MLILLFQLRDADGPFKPRTNGHSVNSVTGSLDWADDLLSDKHRVHPARSFFALGNCIYDLATAISAIAPSEELGKASLASFRVVDDYATLVQLDVREELFEQAHLLLFTYRLDHHVERFDKCRAREDFQFAISAGSTSQFQARDVPRVV